jgi:amino acid adenylation domain-containing protein
MTFTPPAPDAFPASAAQHRLWFLQHRHPASRAYNVTEAVHLRGPVNLEALERAFADLVERHTQLRAVFEHIDGDLVQRIQPVGAPPVRLTVTAVTPGEVDTWLARLAEGVFDLGAGPLCRAAVAEIAPDEHVLAFVVHHIVTDGWASGLFWAELGPAYTARLAGEHPKWTEEAGDYRLAVEAEQRLLSSPEFEAKVTQTASAFAEVPFTLDLPKDSAAAEPATADTLRLPLRDELVAGVDRVATELGATSFMVHAAAFGFVLSRHSGQSELTIGVPAAGRHHPDSELTYGLFVNTVPLPMSIHADDTWANLVARVRDSALQAYTRSDIPIDRLAARLGGAPLQAMLVAQPGEEPLPDLPGTTAARWFPRNQHTKFEVVPQLDTAVAVPPGGGDPVRAHWVALEFPEHSWTRARAERLLAHWELVLTTLTGAPRGRVDELDVATAAEKALRANAYRSTETLTALDPITSFERITRERGETVAVWQGNRPVTYSGLATRVGAIQEALMRNGIGHGDVVGVCLRRTLQLVAALQAILRCGATYVPLDPAYPKDRLDFIAEDSACSLLLVDPDTRDVMAGGTSTVLDVTMLADAPLPPATVARPESQAYLIYTSGSTGRPKGVAIPHRAMHAFLGWAASQFDEADLSVVLASTSVCFDLSVFELFLPLSLGGAIRLVDSILDLAGNAGTEPTLINTVPSAMAELLRSDALPSSTRVVNLAGEALSRALVDLVHEQSTDVRVFNLYGPSEDTTYSTWAEVPRGAPDEPTIGVPIAGTNAYVLDFGLSPVPVGTDGELYLGGLGVALGYHGRPDLTADRFQPDPFQAKPGARMYRTGDRVRLTESGELRYLGRYDHQVKLRGFRIETGEIESRAEEFAGVDQALVSVREVAGSPHLVCYWTGSTIEDELHAALSGALPEYMVPRFWVPLAAFPLTPNGKVDRARLPEPALDTGGADEPATETERAIAALVADLTDSGPLGPAADFFTLGGHSLLAMRLMAALRERLGVEIGLADIFADRTVRAMARRVDRAAEHATALPPLRPRVGTGPAPLAHGQERMWLVDQLRPGIPMLNIGIGLRLSGDVDRGLLRTALQRLTDRHDALRLRVTRDENGELRQRVVSTQQLVLSEVDPSGTSETERVLSEAVAIPFDVATEAPARWMLITEPGAVVLALVIHHVVADAPSLNVLVDEVLADYQALRDGTATLEVPKLSILDYGEWQRNALGNSVLVRRDLAYWRARLADGPERLGLAFDHDPRAATAFTGSHYVHRLDDTAVEALVSIGVAAGATPFMTLLTAYEAFLSRYAGQDDLVVGTPITSRDQVGTERLVGCLLNTLALRVDLTGTPSFTELLGRTRETVLTAFAHQQTPFELVLGTLDVDRAVTHTPVFQTMFVLHGHRLEPAAPSGLRVEYVTVPPVATQYDVTLMLHKDRDGWWAEWNYRTDLFTEATIARLSQGLQAVIAEVAALPGVPIAHLPLWKTLPPQPESTPVPVTFPALFAEPVAAVPDEPAVRDENGALTYRQLDVASSRLAARLAARGVGRGDFVAIVLPRTRAAVTATVGVAKTGAAFICLDPALPAERMSWIAADAGVSVQVTDETLTGTLPGIPELRLDLDRPGEATAEPVGPADAASPCYVIYTSGSTGTPKGVLLPHAGLARLRDLHRSRFAAGPGAQVLQYAPHSFDAWIWESVMALLTGGCLHMASATSLLPGKPLEAMLAERGITHLTMPPSNLAMLSALPESLRHLVLAGEPLHADLVARWGSRVHMWNAYGPSETTVCATIRDCAGLPAGVAPTIGTAFPGAQAYVLDDALNPLPPGAPGELCLGGPGLADCYVGSPELTAERFVPHPDAPGERLYRTGDRARLTAHREIEFLGRADNQIKLRGIRIELGEIERALTGADNRIDDAAVLVEGECGDQHLIAFVAGPSEVDTMAVRSALVTRLPGYMVPAWVQRLDTFPLTLNGKLDRRALAATAEASATAGRTSAPPRGPVEQEVAAIWAALLPGARIGREDSFFALGGTSLTLTRLHERLDARYRSSLKLVDLFRLTTVSAIAGALEEAGAVNPAATDLSFRL